MTHHEFLPLLASLPEVNDVF